MQVLEECLSLQPTLTSILEHEAHKPHDFESFWLHHSPEVTLRDVSMYVIVIKTFMKEEPFETEKEREFIK